MWPFDAFEISRGTVYYDLQGCLTSKSEYVITQNESYIEQYFHAVRGGSDFKVSRWNPGYVTI